jgi:tyrosine-protein kinase Etk/Wzc
MNHENGLPSDDAGARSDIGRTGSVVPSGSSQNGQPRHGNGLQSAPGPQHRSEEAGGRHDGGSPEEAALNLGALWQALRQGWWIILLATLGVAGAVAAYTYTLEPVYRSDSIVAVDTRQTVVAFDQEPVVERHSLSSEVGYLRNSAALAERVIERLQKTAGAVGTDEHFPLLGNSEQTTRQRAHKLMERASFEPISEREMIRIRVESTSPQEASTAANLYARAYRRASREKSRERVVASKQFLQKQVEKRGQKLERLEGQLEHFAREKQVVTQGQGGEALVAEYRSLQQRRDQAQFKLEQEQVSLKLLQQQLAQAKPELEDQVLQESNASELRSQIEGLNRRLADLKARAETHYAADSTLRGRETDVEDLEETKRKIDHFTERKEALTRKLVGKEASAGNTGSASQEEAGGPLGYVARLKSRIAETKLTISELQSQVRALDERLASYDGRLQDLPRQSIERDQLERKIARAERWYNSFVERLQQVQVAEESELGYVKTVRKALVPQTPVRPDMTKNVILGLLLGLGLGTGLAFVRVASDPRLKDPEDVEKQGYDLVGVVPDMDREIRDAFGGRDTVEVQGGELSTSLVTLLNPWSPVAENFRLIKTNLHHATTGANGAARVLLVTSPGPADGKSVVAANTAAAMAQSGRRTLLIDGDLRRSQGHRLFGKKRSPGLADLLTGQQPFRPEDFATSAERLSFLPAGEYDAPPGELLESESMEKLLSGFRRYYDAILIDSPPVLAVTDAMVLAEHSDAAVVVVAANQTDTSALRVTQERLRAIGTHVAGTVVNRADPGGGAVGKGGYEYGYYEQYVGDEQRAGSPAA